MTFHSFLSFMPGLQLDPYLEEQESRPGIFPGGP